jgi:hypothetical protein
VAVREIAVSYALAVPFSRAARHFAALSNEMKTREPTLISAGPNPSFWSL